MANINSYTTQVLRFIKKTASLSTKEISWSEFSKAADLLFVKLDLMEKPDIYSGYFKQMIAVADEILLKIAQENYDLKEFNSWINKEINLLEKAKRVKGYNRKKSFKDLE